MVAIVLPCALRGAADALPIASPTGGALATVGAVKETHHSG